MHSGKAVSQNRAASEERIKALEKTTFELEKQEEEVRRLQEKVMRLKRQDNHREVDVTANFLSGSLAEVEGRYAGPTSTDLDITK